MDATNLTRDTPCIRTHECRDKFNSRIALIYTITLEDSCSHKVITYVYIYMQTRSVDTGLCVCTLTKRFMSICYFIKGQPVDPGLSCRSLCQLCSRCPLVMRWFYFVSPPSQHSFLVITWAAVVLHV